MRAMSKSLCSGTALVFLVLGSPVTDMVPPAAYDAAQALFAHRGPHYGVEQAVIGRPYRFLVTTYEDVLTAPSGGRLLAAARVFRYEFPVILHDAPVIGLSIYKDPATGEVLGNGRGGCHVAGHIDSLVWQKIRQTSPREIVRFRIDSGDFLVVIEQRGDTLVFPCTREGERLLSRENGTSQQHESVRLEDAMGLWRQYAHKRRTVVEEAVEWKRHLKEPVEPTDRK